MAALINALDNYTPLQTGENGHTEYGWSNSIREQILQLNFQLVRTNKSNKLSSILKDLLSHLKHKVNSTIIAEKELAQSYLSILYRMIGHTRDIIDGKGEYNLTYMMIYIWFDSFPTLALFALKCLVVNEENVHPYGSWKDLKYFCEYCRGMGLFVFHPLIQYSIMLMNEQLKTDYDNYKKGNKSISLVAKWIPREKSSFGWLYESLATSYFIHYMETANTEERKKKAILKSKMDYRKLLSELNTVLDTLQIKQCGQNWSEIDFNNVTSISICKQKKAFLNVDKKGGAKYPDLIDRVECSKHFKNHIENAIKSGKEVKGMRIAMADFTKHALEFKLPIEIDLLNSQWRNNSTQTGALKNMIPLVDVSGSMNGDPLYVAIALGIRIAEKSIIGKRALTFSAKPTWVNLEPYPDFVAQVNVLKNAEWGGNTNFYAALDIILDAIIQNKMDPEDVQNLTLVVLSDMQMDQADRNGGSVYDSIRVKYEQAGIRVHGKPYKPPHILMWNLRSTSGFPCLSSQPNASMMSGFSPALLHLFCDQGIDALQQCTPWSTFETSLANERYKIMEDTLIQELSNM
jgi:hypothetical protein